MKKPVSSSKIIYLDHAATTPVDPQVVKAMIPYFTDNFGNPSSSHSTGLEARYAIEGARAEISSFVSSMPEEIVFTSGGTESNNFAIKGVALAGTDKGNHIITSSIEHHSILEACHYLEKLGFNVSYIKVDGEGLVDPDRIKKAITKKTTLISIMHANNEIGSMQPIAEIGSIAKEREICFHTDLVQTFGHIPIDVNRLNIDLFSASAHKFYGPKGVGIVYIRRGTRIHPFMQGGDQEDGRRASTHNVPGIMGMAKAVELARSQMVTEAKRLTRLREKLINGIMKKIEYCRLNGHSKLRLPNNVNLTFEYIDGGSMMLKLDRKGIMCSTSSACSSSNTEPSHVLRAIGLPLKLVFGSLRFSLGKSTSDQGIQYLLKILPAMVEEMRSTSPSFKTKNHLKA
jgi:cysteine desulfurase